MELEQNIEINFLYVLIKRLNKRKSETGVYWKPTSTNIYINFQLSAHAPTDYPMSIINKIAQQEFNDSQIKIRRAETNETPNKIQLILINSEKQGKK